MLRKSFLINLAVSILSTLALMALMPSRAGLLKSVQLAAVNYAVNNALLHPIVFRNILK